MGEHVLNCYLIDLLASFVLVVMHGEYESGVGEMKLTAALPLLLQRNC